MNSYEYLGKVAGLRNYVPAVCGTKGEDVTTTQTAAEAQKQANDLKACEEVDTLIKERGAERENHPDAKRRSDLGDASALLAEARDVRSFLAYTHNMAPSKGVFVPWALSITFSDRDVDDARAVNSGKAPLTCNDIKRRGAYDEFAKSLRSAAEYLADALENMAAEVIKPSKA